MLEADHPGRKALVHVRRILEQKPTKDDHELSFLTRCLAAFREEMIERNRATPPSAEANECLMHLNAIVSVVMGMHFPLGQPPWEEFEKADAWLETLVERVEGFEAAAPD